MTQLDLFADKTKPNNFISEADQKILDGPDYGIIEKHRKVPSVHRLIKFNSELKWKIKNIDSPNFTKDK